MTTTQILNTTIRTNITMDQVSNMNHKKLNVLVKTNDKSDNNKKSSVLIADVTSITRTTRTNNYEVSLRPPTSMQA